MTLYENNVSGEGKRSSKLIDLNEFIPLHKPKKLRQDSDDIYQNNLQALEKHHPELVELIESINIDDDKIKVLDSESGDPRILYKKDDEEEIYIHNAEDPTECANLAVDLLGKMEKEGIAILFGFGLGYFAEEVLKKFEKGHILMVYEATPALFKTALQTRDLTGLLESEQVKIVLGENADNFSVIHSHNYLIANGKFWIVQHQPSIRLNETAYENFAKRLNEEKRISDTGIATVIGRGKEFINAFFMNIPSIIRKPCVSKLKDIFKGRPAVIVSAGPSLDKNLHLLREAKGKAIIIAVDGALPTLLSSNIIPDIVAGIDPVGDNLNDKFNDIPILKGVPFICLAQYTPEVVRMYPGPIFLNSIPHNVANQWLMGFLGNRGYIECPGGSVAHLALSVAEFIGSDKIAFVGQDLSFKGERVHTSGYSDALDRLAEESIKKGLENIPNTIPALNIFDEEVLTIPQFLTFKTSFENRIKGIEGIVINATEEGLPIKGATNMRLKDFIYEYCNNLPEINTISIISALLEDTDSCNMEGLMLEIKGARDKFEEIRKTSKRILKYIKKIKTLKEKGQKDSTELHNILKKVESLIEQVKHPVLNLVAGYHYSLELYLKRQEVEEIDTIEDKLKRLDKQLDRGQIYYSEIVKATGLFNKQLDKLITALEREKRVDSILSDESLEEKERFFKVGMIYKRAGMAAQAVKYLEAVMRDELCVMGDGLQITANESHVTSYVSPITHHASRITVLIALAELYLKQFRFYDAKKVLAWSMGHGAWSMEQEAAVTHHASRITALLKVCDKKIKAWDKRKREMKKLLKDAEANYGSHLESGYFYFRIKDYERAEKAYLKAVMRDELCVMGDGSRVTENEAVMGVTDHASRITHHGSSAAYYGLAHTYLAMDASEKAVSALEKAIEIDPENPILYRDMGIIAIQNNDFASAEIFLTKAIELAPQAEELYKLLSNLYINQGETEKAISLYEDALLVNADNPVIQQDLAMFYKEMIVKNDSPQSSQRTQS